MNMPDIKLYLINGVTLAMSFAQIDMALKIILLSASIGYTLQRWYLLNKGRKEKNEKDK